MSRSTQVPVVASEAHLKALLGAIEHVSAAGMREPDVGVGVILSEIKDDLGNIYVVRKEDRGSWLLAFPAASRSESKRDADPTIPVTPDMSPARHLRVAIQHLRRAVGSEPDDANAGALAPLAGKAYAVMANLGKTSQNKGAGN